MRSLAAGGQGLLWNPSQNCGQPFFGISETGLLYPLNVLFLAFDSQTALRGLLFANLVIGGLGVSGDTACADHEIAKKVRDLAVLNPPGGAHLPDSFRYRLTRQTARGPQTIEISEQHVPMAVRAIVKDELV